jgi:hypothetical protein
LIVEVPLSCARVQLYAFAFLHLDLHLWPSSKLPHRFLGHFGPAESSGELRTRDPRRNASCSAKQRATDIMGKLNQCNRCDRVSLVPLRALKHPPDTPVWKLEAALYCEPCSEGRHYSRRQRAHILGLTYARPEPESPRATSPRNKQRG